MNEYRKPAWWRLYLLYALMVALLFAQAGLNVSEGWHQLMELGVTGTMLGLMAWWTRRNAAALEDAAILHKIEQQAAERHVTLTPVQAHYLLVQLRTARKHAHGNN